MSLNMVKFKLTFNFLQITAVISFLFTVEENIFFIVHLLMEICADSKARL